jgi:transposase
MHEPYRLSPEQWVPQCRLIYDKFHVMQHANEAVTEVRRAEFFRKGGAARELIKGKHWLLLTRWVHLNTNKKRQLNQTVRAQPPGDEGLSVEGELGSTLELYL